MFAGVYTLPFNPETPALPQIRAEDDSSSDDEDDMGITSGGTISANEIICGPGVPTAIKNVTEPTGEIEGFLVLRWEKKILGEGWVVIPGANGLDYEPEHISNTTIYRRGCRESSEQPWMYSNPVSKKVVPKIESVQLSATKVTCNGGSDGTVTAAVAGGTAGYVFDWIVDDETGNELTDIPAGFYSVIVTDQNGCKYASDHVEVVEPESVMDIFEVFQFEPSCPGYENGGIFVEAYNGIPPYEFTWSNGVPGPALIDVPAGTYDVTVTDALGCKYTRSDMVLNEPDPIQLHNQSVPASCFDTADASAIITAVGGTSPYLYRWPDGSFGNSKNGLAAGTYNVNVIDNNGCSSAETVTIVQPEEMEITPFTLNNKICKASINVVPDGGTAPYTYEWEDGNTTSTQTNLCPGFYTVQITDNNGCETTETLEIVAEIAKEEIAITVIVNPFQNEGNVVIKLPFDDYADVRIYSPTGQLIEVFLHEEAELNQEIRLSLDIDKYSNGIYIMEVSSGGLSSSEKVIVSN